MGVNLSMYKFQEEVRCQADAFVTDLRDHGFFADLLEHTFRDYCVKVSVFKETYSYGNIVVYYKPSNNTYNLGTHELVDKSIISEIELIWNDLIGVKKDNVDESDGTHVYVDGSYINGTIGYGVVVIDSGKVIEERFGNLEDAGENVKRMRQVSGEIRAVYEAIEWAKLNGIEKIHIHYDYVGLENWATGVWKAKNDFTKAYQFTMQNTPVLITWHKVESHSGDHWNERADELARSGADSRTSSDSKSPDPLQELDDVVSSFAEHLLKKSIQANFKGIYNTMFARIVINQKDIENILDIYQTKRHLLEPKWYGFHDQKLKAKVQNLWRNFIGKYKNLQFSKQKKSCVDLLDYYYNILKPYRNHAFDFIEFAELLMKQSDLVDQHNENIETLRFNFGKLEKIYMEINGRNHG